MADGNAVFIVDDDASVRRSLERVLRSHGFDAIGFDSGAALRDHNNFEQARCLVIDINLGNESGIDLRQELQDEGVSLPVIFITGNDTQATRRAAMKSGCLAYLTKPFAASVLIQSIEQA